MNPSAPPSRSGTILLNALDAALLLALLLMPVIWFYDSLAFTRGPLHFSASWGFKPLLLSGLLLAARLVWRQLLRRKSPGIRGLADSGFYHNLCLALLPTFFLLLALEGTAKLAGIDPVDSAPIVIVGEEQTDTHIEDNKIVKDPELLWAFKPGYKWDNYRVNRHGFRTREFSAEKPAGTRRLIALGDSCTAQGRPPYSDHLHELLQREPPTAQPWEAFNMGVYGYSVMQGYRQFLKHGRGFTPDVVTIYYGWNDHWLNDKPDHQRLAVRMNRFSAATIEALRNKRLYGGLTRLIRRPASAPPSGQRAARVPLDLYVSTLSALIGEIRETGALPIVLTAPRRRVPPGGNHPVNADEIHDQYVEATRQVARDTGAELLDLAALLAAAEHDPLFSKDGVHFTQDGLEKIAEILHGRLKEMADAGRFD